MFIVQYQHNDLKLYLSLDGYSIHKVVDPTNASQFSTEDQAINAASLSAISKGDRYSNFTTKKIR